MEEEELILNHIRDLEKVLNLLRNQPVEKLEHITIGNKYTLYTKVYAVNCCEMWMLQNLPRSFGVRKFINFAASSM